LTNEWSTLKFSEVTVNSALGLFYLILFGSLIGFVSYAWLLRKRTAFSRFQPTLYVKPGRGDFSRRMLG